MKIKQIVIPINDSFNIELPKGGIILEAEQSKIDGDNVRIIASINESIKKMERVNFGVYTVEQDVPVNAKYICKSLHPYYRTPRYIFELGRVDIKEPKEKSESKDKAESKEKAEPIKDPNTMSLIDKMSK